LPEVVGILARTSHLTCGNVSQSFGAGSVKVLESTGTDAGPVRVGRAPPPGVDGGVNAGEISDAGGSVDKAQSDREWGVGLACGDCIGGKAGEA
jgi:hypothetical protein